MYGEDSHGLNPFLARENDNPQNYVRFFDLKEVQNPAAISKPSDGKVEGKDYWSK